MKRYRFGIGEYKYYHTPLPDQLQQIRDNLYPELAKAANRWLEQLNKSPEYPETLEMFLDQCHQGAETTYPANFEIRSRGYNCLHQDLYGDIFFPFQVVFTLNQQNEDYTGGEFYSLNNDHGHRAEVMSLRLIEVKVSFFQLNIDRYWVRVDITRWLCDTALVPSIRECGIAWGYIS